MWDFFSLVCNHIVKYWKMILSKKYWTKWYFYIILHSSFVSIFCIFVFSLLQTPLNLNFVTVLLINDIDSNTNKYMIYSTHRFRKFFRWLLKTTSLHIIFVKHVALFFLFKLFQHRVSSVVTRWKLDFIHVIFRHG